jgi:putative phosphoesterase
LKEYAVLSDIHGNIWALEAVLKDIQKRDIDRIINLGDSLYGPLDPEATARCLMHLPHDGIRGNQDRILTTDHQPSDSSALIQVRESLKPDILQWLVSQPAVSIVDENLFLCHGTPESDRIYLLEDATGSVIALREETQLRSMLEPVQQMVILCGHSHTPRIVQLSDGRLVVNPGSVGLPAYTDTEPVPHRMETGSPHARYAVLTETDSDWMVELIAIPYAWGKAVDQACRNGRNDWAAWLESGRAD